MPTRKFLRFPDLLDYMGCGKTFVYTAMEKHGFPKPVKLGPRINAWRLEEVDAWLDSRPRAS